MKDVQYSTLERLCVPYHGVNSIAGTLYIANLIQIHVQRLQVIEDDEAYGRDTKFLHFLVIMDVL